MRVKYFAYGSNMSHNVISEVCPSSRSIGPAKLKDHRLAFTLLSTKWGARVADILPAPGMCVWGVLYKIDKNEVVNLDRKERYGKAYTRINVSLIKQNGVEHQVITYTVISKKSIELSPSTKYLKTMIEGAKDHKIPNKYIHFLKSLKSDENRWSQKGFFVYPTESRQESGGMHLLKISKSMAKKLDLKTIAAVTYREKACLVKVVHLNTLDNNSCQIDQTIRNILGFPGRECYGTFVNLFPVEGMELIFSLIKPRSLVLPLHRPSWLHSEKNICILHEDNIRLLGLNEGEYVKIRTVVLAQNGRYRIRKITLRVFSGTSSKRKIRTETYPKVDRIYIDLDGRFRLGIPKDIIGTPLCISADIGRLFASRLLYYGITLFLGFIALDSLIQEILSKWEISKILVSVATLIFSATITLTLCFFDIKGKIRY